ncbi:APC family permease [Planobispora takensis]|uniref:Amino acid permease n=1 Tax=Planobispora takensis TaxID=1367882 RepID=A0A8J3T1J5_9ACTN|nr:amino acid permease [Planobispora takensis]GII03417.1 amino acid permease [Planobispora takensis]
MARGTGLFLGAVLGPGVLALPHLAAAAAGPASVVAWAALLALSVPVALTFAALGGRFPDGGGVATFARRAFGPRAAAVTGWWFYFTVPIGVPAAAMIAGEYVASGLGLGPAGTVAVTCALLVAAFAANHAGLRFSGGLQLLLAGLLVALLVAAVAAALPAVRPQAFTPFAPHGWSGAAHAAGVLFFAFVGWEAASHLSAEFADPRRHLVRATVLTLAIVGVLYLGLAVTTIGVLGERAATSPVPLALLLEHGAGQAARPVTAVVALLLSFGAINTYVAGGARLGAALARDGALPARLAGPPAPAGRDGGGAGDPLRGPETGDPLPGPEAGAPVPGPGERAPHRSLAALALMSGVLTAVALAYGIGLDPLMRATSACLAAVTVVGVAAATRLLAGAGRRTAVVATVFTLVLLASCGPYLLVPAALAAAGLVISRLGRAAGTSRIRVFRVGPGSPPGTP